MQYLQQIECGLPSTDFVVASPDQKPLRHIGNGPRQVRLRPNSPWQANRAAGERLTWRGRNFIEGFAAVNHCELVLATVSDLPAGQYQDLIFGGPPAGGLLEHYHFVCDASVGSMMQAGDSVVALRAGDLWRVSNRDARATVRGGCEGGMQLVLVLACRKAGVKTALLPNDRRLCDVQSESEAAA